MQLAAALLTIALAAPAPAGVPAASVGGTGVSVSLALPAPATLDHGESRRSRARAPVPPALRRMLRKRDMLAPLHVGSGHVARDPSVSLLAHDLGRSSASRIGRARLEDRREPIPLHLLLAGIHARALCTPPPTLPD